MKLLIQNLNYKISKKILLDNININASSNSIIGIIGANGAGKSTLLKHIAMILLPKNGTVKLDEIDLTKLKPQLLAKKIAYLSQFSNASNMRVLETLELGRRAYSGMFLSKLDYKKIDNSIKEFGLEELLERNLDSLSGGERQKVLIASSLLQEPNVLLLDEPISHLDPKNQHDMLRAINITTLEKGLITFIVLHDIQHALHYTTDLIMLKNGKIIYNTPTKFVEEYMLEELFDIKVNLYTSHGHKFIYYGHSHVLNSLNHNHE